MNESPLSGPDNMMTNWSNFSSTGSTTPTLNFGGHLVIFILIVYNGFALFGNLLIMKVVPKIPTDAMGDSSKVCLIGQAVIDAVVSALFIIGPFSETVGDWTGWTYGRLSFCRVVGVVAVALVGVSILQISLLNTDRYLFIVRPMLYPRIATPNRVLGVSIGLSAFHISLIFLFLWMNDASVHIIQYDLGLKMCIVNFQEAVFLPFSYCVFGEAWLTMLFLVTQYCHIIKISTKHLNRIKPNVILPNNHEVGPSNRRDNTASPAVLCAPSTSIRADVQENNGIDRLKPKTLFGKYACDSPDETLASRNTLVQIGYKNKTSIDEGNSDDCTKSNVEITFNGQPCVNKLVNQTLGMETTAEPLGPTKSYNHDKHIHPRTSHSPHRPSGSSNEQLPSASTPTLPNIGRRQGPRPARRPEPSQLRRNLRILRTPFIITSCYFFSFLPVTFINIYVASTGRSVNPLFHAFFSILVAFNGGVNIIVYYFTIKPFRQILKNTLRRR